MNIFSTVWNYITGGANSTAETKLLSEILVFLAGAPYTQIAGAALAEGTNIPLDIAAATALFNDFIKAFYSGQTVQTATMTLTTKVGIAPIVAAQIIYDPVHPVDPTQFSRGR
jgi:hypothetical protein